MNTFHYRGELVGNFDLSAEDSSHAIRVLRLKEGDEIQLLNGEGSVASATILRVTKKACSVHVLDVNTVPKPTREIHIAIAPTKSIDRFEFFLEKATELGVTRITPLLCERSERKRIRHDRCEKVLIAAMKQSQRAWLPSLDELTNLSDLVDSELPHQRYFGWCKGMHESLMDTFHARDAIVVIGPEGDFSDSEASMLRARNFTPISIGDTRLRTETAGIAACTWMNLSNR